MSTRTFPVIESASAAARLDAAAAFLHAQPSDAPVTIVGATRGAADDLARRIAIERPATFGLVRLSLTQLAARTALVALAERRMTPTTWLGAEAVAARAVFEAGRDGALSYFAPVAATPGFSRALARTLQELRLTAVEPDRLGPLPRAGRDLERLLARFEAAFASAGTADRSTLFSTAATMLGRVGLRGALVLLDVPLEHPAECALAAAAVRAASDVLATVPRGDANSLEALTAMGGAPEHPADEGRGDLAALRRFLFEPGTPPAEGALDGSLEFFSAPGEGRECVEIARRVVAHARAGIRFDEMAILIRSPGSYYGLLEHALARANVPVCFDRGTRRPHPAGRAFLALLTCASEALSAARFAEYLSLGQVPGDHTPGDAWAASADESLRAAGDGDQDEDTEPAAPELRDPDAPVVGGTLRAPWRWEQLLGSASVIGQSAARWRRRLEGYGRELERQILEAGRQDGLEGGKVRALELTRAQLGHLQAFALPLIERLEAWPAEATWGDWLDRFEQLAPHVLRAPAHVQRVLADLRPMAGIGPVTLAEARRVLAERLLTLESEPPARRFGRVFAATPQQVRGRTFRVVFVPGLAERLFPQKPREDPLLLDDLRRVLDAPLALQRHRLESERLLLRLAAGAATGQLHVSYPRIELSESRARVPSFYALDVMRAATGRLPDHESLEEHARDAGRASLAWPAPPRPEDAIDDLEHDLAVLRRLVDHPDRAAVRGHAHYLLGLNEALRRSVVDRWARGQNRWSPSDGLIRVTPATAPALDAQRLTRRSYSLSALQKFSACPYQFVLSAVFRLQPLEAPQPLQRMDPLTRGSLFHEIQAAFFRALDATHQLPVTHATIDAAAAVLEDTIQRVAARARDELAPAVERVWSDEIASLRRDLEGWLRHLADEGEEWIPRYFELAFGTVPGERDPRSQPTDAVLERGFRLRGAIDLIEEHRTSHALRVTDHKTGRRPDRLDRIVIDGGRVLQPVLYGLATEAVLGGAVAAGRLFYCTSAAGYASHAIALDERARAAGLEALEVIDRAIGSGFLAAAPAEDACRWCDYAAVCGPEVPRRIRRKPQDRLADLLELRNRP